MPMPVRRHAVLGLMLTLWIGSTVLAETPAETPEFFETKVRPVLVNRCYECHGNGQAKGKLSLDSPAGALKGGENGPSVVPGKPEESLLLDAVRHEGGLQMPPKGKLADSEIADLTAWVAAGARWPSVRVAIPLGNLFDDSAETSLGDALATDSYKADAQSNDLAVDRVQHGWAGVGEVSPGVRFDFGLLGGTKHEHGPVINDAWGNEGGLSTQGKAVSSPDRMEDGIGLHANAFVTFDLTELRTAGGLPPDQAFTFRCDRAGLDDSSFGSGATAHVMVLVSRVMDSGKEVSVYVNGQPAEVVRDNEVFKLKQEAPAPMRGDGKFASFEIPVGADARYVTLAATSADAAADNPISSDHTVFSGARLELETTSSSVARLGRTELAATPYVISEEQRRFWSFQPIRETVVPAVKDTAWLKKPLDAFILQRLEATGLKSVAPADKTAWLRRVTFDMLGLPPSPEEMQAFLADSSPEAHHTVVERLLASPHYGERWGRYWLDIARYGEDQAHTFGARGYPQGYRFRDWVVKSLNNDLPYDRFAMLQIAGDQLEPVAGEDPQDRLVAQGYFALGPVYYADAGCAAKAALDELDDRIDTLSRGFLGLTLACARCHDHKFDPIPQTDYYALGGVFRSTNYREAPLVAEEVVKAYEAGQTRVKQQEQKVTEFLSNTGRQLAEAELPKLKDYLTALWQTRHPAKEGEGASRKELVQSLMLKEQALNRAAKFFGKPDNRGKAAELPAVFEALGKEAGQGGEPPAELVAALKSLDEAVQKAVAERADPNSKSPGKDSPLLAEIIGENGFLRIPKDQLEKQLDETQKQALAALKAEVETVKKTVPPMYATAHSLIDGTVADMKLHVRGNPTRTGPEVPRHFLSILSPESPAAFAQGSGRLELARAVASPQNPLTPRVIVNRVWQQHFGRGLVNTPSNFGALGERPSHPELLDYLAHQFMAHGWSIKWLHREILLSATYGLSAANDPHNQEVDPENISLWRMNRRRLDIEAWRDAMLAVSGRLDLTVGGPSSDLGSADNNRRTFYGKISRHNLDGVLRLFDFPDPNITSDKRTVTTVPLQQLFVLNSEFMIQQSRALASRLQAATASDEGRIQQAFSLLYGRSPTPQELSLGRDFLAIPAEPNSQLSPWEQYAQILLGANEFTFVD